jgi:hypothetical protein
VFRTGLRGGELVFTVISSKALLIAGRTKCGEHQFTAPPCRRSQLAVSDAG